VSEITPRRVEGPEAGLPSPPSPEWTEVDPPDHEAVRQLARELSLPPAICAVLVARGIVEAEPARRFLRPRLEHLLPPEALPDLKVAVDRIARAVESGEIILIHGDFDVDGVASTALLTRWLRRLGGTVVPFVPHRIRDGYDLGSAGIRAASEAGASLLVTCDSGIRAHDAVNEARARGIEVIITDHHTPASTLPEALAVVNPMREDVPATERVLCGAGVAWKLCAALAERFEIAETELFPLLEFVALATIADLVPLSGDNRILVRFGLRYLANSQTPGIRALLRKVGVEEGEAVSESAVGFRIAPRINAIGRMGDAATALELLLTDDPRAADELAAVLEEANATRQNEERRTLEEALALLAEDYDPARDFGVVLAREGWHPGVIGIVAARVVERIHRPVLLIALDGAGGGKGSGRSVTGVHLLQALTEGCAPFLRRFGGHRQAAGVDVEASQIHRLRDAFNIHIRGQLGGVAPRPRHTPDLRLPLDALNDEFERLLQHMAPFGMGNRRPLFQVTGLTPADSPREVGGGSLKVRLRGGQGGAAMDAIGFGLAKRLAPADLSEGPFDALLHLERNEYRGRSTLQARLLDLRLVGAGGLS